MLRIHKGASSLLSARVDRVHLLPRRNGYFVLLLAVLLGSSPAFASRLVTDEAGRRVALPDHPHRIVCLVQV